MCKKSVPMLEIGDFFGINTDLQIDPISHCTGTPPLSFEISDREVHWRIRKGTDSFVSTYKIFET